MEAKNPVLTESVRRTLAIMLAVMVLALVLTSFAGVLITRSITAPLARGGEGRRAVAEGDLEAQIEVDSRDETGQLLGSLAGHGGLAQADGGARPWPWPAGT